MAALVLALLLDSGGDGEVGSELAHGKLFFGFGP
jgi:hypothetical protein